MFVITMFLSPNEVGVLSFSGDMVRAAFLRLVKNFDENLAVRIHDRREIKPYSVTPVYVSHLYSPRLEISLDKVYRFRVSLLYDDLFKEFLKHLVTTIVSPIIGNIEFTVRKVSVHNVDFEGLIKEPKIAEKFSIRFYTPTYFSKRGIDFNKPLPAPVNVFYNLIKTWNSFSSIKFNGKSFREWVNKSVIILSYQLKIWKPVDISGVEETMVFTGWCDYRIVKSGDYSIKEHEMWRSLTYALGRFAEIANVGGNRTAGFGVVKFVPQHSG